MAGKKDYSNKALKWKNRKAKIKSLIKYGILIAVTVFLILFFLFDVTVVRDNSLRTSLLKGDLVFINKLSYGPFSLNNIPLTRQELYSGRLFEISKPSAGDVLEIQQFYKDSVSNKEYVYNYFRNCIGGPGDLFSVTDSAIFINGLPTYLDIITPPDSLSDSLGFTLLNFQDLIPAKNIEEVFIPAKGTEIPLTPENFKFWKLLIQSEMTDVVISSENGKVFMNGNRIQSYTFKNDYYAVTGFSELPGKNKISWSMVPFENIVGKAEFVCFSYTNKPAVSSITDIFKLVRWKRFFNSVK